MGLYKDGCGHPTEWNLRVVFQGRKFSYCLGCIVEKLGLDNLELYDNPFIQLNKVPIKEKPKNKKE